MMTDYEFIMAQCLEFHFTKWNEEKRSQRQEGGAAERYL
jgi:hypothetical protein